MRLIFTTLFLLFAFLNLKAQNLTGVWRGNFEQSNLDVGNSRFVSDKYKYEVQINDLQTNSLEGVTYSYLTTVFYGKAALKGMCNKKNKTVTIKETVMLDIKSTGRTEPCLMTCYLDYNKIGKLETLIGTYSSINANTKRDCGSGTVYLEKVEESDFEKESFLTKKVVPKKAIDIAKEKTTKHPTVKKHNPNFDEPVVKTPTVTKTDKTKNSTLKTNTNKATTKNNSDNTKTKTNTAVQSKLAKVVKPGAEKFIYKKDDKSKKDSAKTEIVKLEPKQETKTKEEPKEITKSKIIAEPTEPVLTERINVLASKIFVDAKEITLEFYDNGEIDNDTISVYKDNKLVLDRRRLSTTPIKLTLHFDEINTFYELITVAENLGDIPPNTALMVISYGRKRQEVFLKSDEKTNAKLIIEYKP